MFQAPLQMNMIRDTELLSLLFTALDTPELLVDHRFIDPLLLWENRKALGDEIERRIATRSSAQWMQLFDEFELPVNLIARVEEKPTDVQVLENEIAVPPADPEMGVALLINHPLKISSVPQVEARRPPGHGEHSVEILKELGYEDAVIQKYQDTGVI